MLKSIVPIVFSNYIQKQISMRENQSPDWEVDNGILTKTKINYFQLA